MRRRRSAKMQMRDWKATSRELHRAAERSAKPQWPAPANWDGVIILEAARYRLAGVSDGPSTVAQWWKFDGTPLPEGVAA